jgi:hypothetical protein
MVRRKFREKEDDNEKLVRKIGEVEWDLRHRTRECRRIIGKQWEIEIGRKCLVVVACVLM